MNTFIDFNKKVVTNMASYYTYSYGTPTFFETDDAIYLDGIPCDKYNLSPITFYKDKIRAYMNSMPFNISPITNTRYYNRYIGDSGRLPYRLPYLPVNTLFKNNCRFSNGDEAIITPTSSYGDRGRTNSMIVVSKITNKITSVNGDDLGVFKPSIVNLDDSRVIAGNKNAYLSGADTGIISAGRRESSLICFNKDTNTKDTISLGSDGYVHNVIGKTLNGDMIVLTTMNSGDATMNDARTIRSIFIVSKINKVNLTVTNLLTVPITPDFNSAWLCFELHHEPALTLDNKTVYFANGAIEDVQYRGAKYTINKCTIDMDKGTATSIPQTINLNGLVPALFHIPEVYDTYHKTTQCTNIILSYLEFGNKKYLVATNTTNNSYINGVTYGCNYNTATKANYDKYCFMYLFEINGDTLTLTDYRQGLGGYTDIPQAVFPMNNAKNLLIIRENGLDIMTVDTTTSKFIIQDTIAEKIYSCGIDDLERVWYVTSLDGMVNDAQMKVFSVGAVVLVNTDFENTNLTYVDTDIDSNIIVSTRNNVGNRVSANMQLLLEGNAIFTSTNSKTINISTNNASDTIVPIKVQGDGMISIYSNILT